MELIIHVPLIDCCSWKLDHLFQRWQRTQIPDVLVDRDYDKMTLSQPIRDEDTVTRANQRAAWSRLRPGFSSLLASVSLCSSESSSPSSSSASSPRETREENEGFMKLRNFLTRQTECTQAVEFVETYETFADRKTFKNKNFVNNNFHLVWHNVHNAQ